VAIRPTDAYRLWGRAGGRCSVCRASLTRVALDGVLGEIAHIVARSPGGPRGDDPLPAERRDSYDNLILLCPNHHTEVDRDIKFWPSSKLREQKASHEQWVQGQIDEGRIAPIPERAEELRQSRLKYWSEKRGGRWLYVALTPLDIREDALDPLTAPVREYVKSMRIPDQYAQGLSPPNPYHIEPSASGLVVEDFRKTSAGSGGGYRVELRRSGHVEIVLSLEALIDYATGVLSDPKRSSMLGGYSDHRLSRCEYLLEYDRLVRFAEAQTSALTGIWGELDLPFREMVFTLAIIAVPNLCLLVHGGDDYRMGRPAEESIIAHAFVVTRSDELLGPAMMRVVNAFGFTLDRFRDERGKPQPPMGSMGF